MFSFVVHAATQQLNDVNQPASFKDLEIVFSNVLQAVLAFAGIVLFITFIMGGFNYITSGGDPKKLESAKNTITYAIYGIIAVALAYLILVAIANFTNVKSILNFQVTQ